MVMTMSFDVIGVLSNGSRIGNYTFGNYGVSKGLKTGLGGLAMGTMGSPESRNRVLTAEEQDISMKMNDLLGVGVGMGSPSGVGKGNNPIQYSAAVITLFLCYEYNNE